MVQKLKGGVKPPANDGVLRLSEIKTPMLVVEVAEGDERVFDPFEMLRKIEPQLKLMENLDLTTTLPSQIFEKLKEAFGLDVTDYQMIVIVRKLTQLVSEAAEIKKD